MPFIRCLLLLSSEVSQTFVLQVSQVIHVIVTEKLRTLHNDLAQQTTELCIRHKALSTTN